MIFSLDFNSHFTFFIHRFNSIISVFILRRNTEKKTDFCMHVCLCFDLILFCVDIMIITCIIITCSVILLFSLLFLLLLHIMIHNLRCARAHNWTFWLHLLRYYHITSSFMLFFWTLFGLFLVFQFSLFFSACVYFRSERKFMRTCKSELKPYKEVYKMRSGDTDYNI